jgi:glycosyltransferase involved in cell wall biosynthesis
MNTMLTIVIPTFNRPSTLGDALISIFMQKASFCIEVLVIDNASDNANENMEVIDTIKKRYANTKIIINYYLQPKNYWVVKNKHDGVLKSLGTYVMIMDDDDFFINPNFIQLAISSMVHDEKIACSVFQVARLLDDASHNWAQNVIATSDHTTIDYSVVNGDIYFRGFWTKFGPRQPNACIVRKDILEKRHWYDFPCNDQSFHLICAPANKVVVSESIIGVYRKHSRSGIASNQSSTAKPDYCAYSNSAIKKWSQLGSDNINTSFYCALLWRCKNLVLKEQGPIKWLSLQNHDVLDNYYSIIRERSFFDYFVLRYFSLAQIRVDYVSADSDSISIRQKLAYKIRRFFAIGILKLDRLVH